MRAGAVQPLLLLPLVYYSTVCPFSPSPPTSSSRKCLVALRLPPDTACPFVAHHLGQSFSDSPLDMNHLRFCISDTLPGDGETWAWSNEILWHIKNILPVLHIYFTEKWVWNDRWLELCVSENICVYFLYQMLYALLMLLTILWSGPFSS